MDRLPLSIPDYVDQVYRESRPTSTPSCAPSLSPFAGRRAREVLLSGDVRYHSSPLDQASPSRDPSCSPPVGRARRGQGVDLGEVVLEDEAGARRALGRFGEG